MYLVELSVTPQINAKCDVTVVHRQSKRTRKLKQITLINYYYKLNDSCQLSFGPKY